MSFWRKTKKIGLALSGGGARGLAHIGVLEVLESEGIKISAISGTSMGSVIGALYSSGIPVKDMLAFIDSNDWKMFVISSNFNIPNLTSLNSRRVDKLIYKFLGDKDFKECSIPFCAVAADIISKNTVYLTSGKLREAVKASIAIPSIFEPLVRDGMILIDGGVVEPVPIGALSKTGCDFIIASALDNLIRKEKPTVKTTIFAYIDLSLAMMERAISEKTFSKADVLIQPLTGDHGVFDFAKAKEIINLGRLAALDKLSEIKKKIN